MPLYHPPLRLKHQRDKSTCPTIKDALNGFTTKDGWKDVIKEQLVKHLKDIGVEEGFVRSETRYFEASKETYLTESKYESKVLELLGRINRSLEG